MTFDKVYSELDDEEVTFFSFSDTHVILDHDFTNIDDRKTLFDRGNNFYF